MRKYLTTSDMLQGIVRFVILTFAFWVPTSIIFAKFELSILVSAILSFLFSISLSFLIVNLLMKLKARTNKEKYMMMWEAKKDIEKQDNN